MIYNKIFINLNLFDVINMMIKLLNYVLMILVEKNLKINFFVKYVSYRIHILNKKVIKLKK